MRFVRFLTYLRLPVILAPFNWPIDCHCFVMYLSENFVSEVIFFFFKKVKSMETKAKINNDVEKRGWLKKKGNKQGLWHNRYVSMNEKSIIISKDDQFTNIDSVVPMCPEVTFEVMQGSTPRFSIKPAKSDEAIVFTAPSNEEVSQWFAIFRTAQSSAIPLSMEDFQIISVIGRGYYGKVMLCRRFDNDKLYAIKSIRKQRLAESDGCSVLTEKNIMMRIHHPFIVNLCFAFQTETKVYLGLEYAPGGELFYYMESSGTVPIDDARMYIAEIGLALSYLHQYGIIYRDLKPENVLFDADGHIKLTDFGLSKELGCDKTAQTFCGTPDYLAPEIILAYKYGTKVDEWALGILAYEMILGRTPYYNDNKNEMFEEIVTLDPYFPDGMDPRIVNFIMKLLTKDPERRPNFEDLKDDPFFEGVDWDAVYNRQYEPSYIPEVKNRFSTDNFDPEFTTELATDSFVTPGLHNFGNINGFSFVQPNFV